MKRINHHLVLLFSIINFSIFSQIVISNCNAPDSIIKKYKDDADKLAVVRVYNTNSTYKDSVRIYQPIAKNYLNALLAVYNATSLLARDTVVALKIHKKFNPILNSLLIEADSNLLWMKNFRSNIFPTGNATIDNLYVKYYLTKDIYYSWAAFPNALLVLKTDTNCNMDALALKFLAVPNVYISEPNNVFGDGNNITDSVGANYTQIVYSYGWGDCPSGCGSRRFWAFKVYNDCSVEYVGSYGNPLPQSAFVGIQEKKPSATNIKIYPNPFKDNINLDFQEFPSNSKVRILNALGQIVYRKDNLLVEQEINLNYLQAGMYYLIIQYKFNQETVKIIKY